MVTRTAVTGTAVPPTRTQTSKHRVTDSDGSPAESVLTLREEPGPFEFKLNAAGEQVIMMGMYIMIPHYAGREPASVSSRCQ